MRLQVYTMEQIKAAIAEHKTWKLKIILDTRERIGTEGLSVVKRLSCEQIAILRNTSAVVCAN